MTIKESFIKAEKDGWGDHYDAKGCEQSAIDHAIIDPSYWKALGKSMGWPKIVFGHCGKDPKDYNFKGSVGACCFFGSQDCEWFVSSGLYHQHKILTHLDEGGTIESYFKDL